MPPEEINESGSLEAKSPFELRVNKGSQSIRVDYQTSARERRYRVHSLIYHGIGRRWTGNAGRSMAGGMPVPVPVLP